MMFPILLRVRLQRESLIASPPAYVPDSPSCYLSSTQRFLTLHEGTPSLRGRYRCNQGKEIAVTSRAHLNQNHPNTGCRVSARRGGGS